jgi:type IV secretion system protein VirB11
MQSGLGLSRSETIDYARSVVDVVVQLGREGAERKIVAIEELAGPDGPKEPREATLRGALDKLRAA